MVAVGLDEDGRAMTTHATGFHIRRTPASVPGAPTVLLIHGFLDDASVWDDVIDALAGEITTISYDLPGFGRRSDSVTDIAAITLQALTAEAGDIVAGLDGAVVVVGQSLGSQIAELVAAAHPDQVRGLVLLTPVPLGGTQLPDEVVAQFRAIDGDSAAQRAARSELSPRLTDTQLDRLTAVGTPVAAGVAARYVDVWNAGYPAAPARSSYGGPVLIVRGGGDGFVTAAIAETIAARFTGAETHVVDRGGHWLHVEYPGTVAAMILDFTDAIAEERTALPHV